MNHDEPPRGHYVAEVEIEAPPEAVWATLVDLPTYAEWNPFTPGVVSSLELGAPVDLTVRMSGWGVTLEQREHVTHVEAPRRLDWSMTLGPAWLLSGARTQTLTPLDGGRTRYRTEDVISGALSPLVRLLFGRSLTDGFNAMARALAVEVERR